MQSTLLPSSRSILGCKRVAQQPLQAARPCQMQRPAFRASATAQDKDLGFKTMRSGIKEAAADSILTPRFYTTDFDEMEQLFSMELNPNLDTEELEAMLKEFRTDYNQTHFVRNETFKKAADNVQVSTGCLGQPARCRMHGPCWHDTRGAGRLLCLHEAGGLDLCSHAFISIAGLTG